MIKILLVHNHLSRFVALDRDLMAEFAEVTELAQPRRRTNARDVLREVRRHDVVVSWFASWHSLWPVTVASLLRRPTVTIIGGYDVANLPEIGYGHQRGGIRQFVSRQVIRSSTSLVTSSYYSLGEISRNIGPAVAARTRVIHHGVLDVVGRLPLDAKEPLVLTVGVVSDSNLQRKGLELFVRTAAAMPDTTFVLAGPWVDSSIDDLRRLATPNLRFTGWLEDDALAELYARASVYVQASQHESFGLSVAESMLAGAIPVVSDAGSLPEVVGPIGTIVSHPAPNTLVAAIRPAIEASHGERVAARDRVITEFSLDARRRELEEVVTAALGDALLARASGFGTSRR